MPDEKESLRDKVRGRKDRQLATNAARNIANEVKTWRNDWQEAADRWPWELLQNARDTAVSNKRMLKASFSLSGNRFIFAHDGGPFSFDDITALILGGSAKIYDSSALTGRFGTGFLVTHAISAKVSISGQSEDSSSFRVDFDRRGSQPEIEANIRCSEEQLDHTPNDLSVIAQFEYEELDAQGREVVKRGMDALDSLLPYVLCFNSAIAEVSIALPETSLTWVSERSNGNINSKVSVMRVRRIQGQQSQSFLVYEGREIDNSRFAALFREGSDGIVFAPPSPESLRIYKEFPLLRSAGVGLPVSWNASFDVDETRSVDFLGKDSGSKAHTLSEPEVGDTNQQLARSAISELADFLEYVGSLDCPNSYLAFQISLPTEQRLANSQFWKTGLASVAEMLKSRPLVKASKTEALIAPRNCYFISPMLSRANPGLRVNPIGFWSLVNRFTFLNLPVETISSDWTTIVDGWKSLGVSGITVWTVDDLTQRVRASKSVRDLAQDIGTDDVGAVGWIAEFWNWSLHYAKT